ncbi:MAG: SDR family NAD(P)-dependent oxidoreductase [Candidatus Woesearchaeota archaeon]
MNPVKNFALITGASSGIGLEFAKVFAREGHNLILVARSKNTLETLREELIKKYDVEIKIIVKDLTYYSSPTEIYDEVKSDNINVNILINNAGFGMYGEFSKTDLDIELQMIQVNITALTHLTKLFLKDMIENNSGRILNVASVAAFVPGPLMSVYYATKAYVISFSEALAEELKDTKIKVTTLCPGPIKTNFQKTANINGYSKHIKKENIPTGKEVAEYGYKALYNNKRIAIYQLKYKALVQLTKFLPRTLVTKLLKKIQEKRNK